MKIERTTDFLIFNILLKRKILGSRTDPGEPSNDLLYLL